MLVLRGIARAFGRRRAVAGVSLDVAAGEAVLLVGRNGAGKTTLLRIAAGFLDPDAGEVFIDGISVAADRARAQRRLGYLPEHAPAPGELTVREYLALRARLKGAGDASIVTGAADAAGGAAAAGAAERPRGARAGSTAAETQTANQTAKRAVTGAATGPAAETATEAAINRAVALAGLQDVQRQRIATLSKGFRQRVGLADALLGDPPLVILDEPTSGMDPIQVRQLRDHLRAAARDRAVLVSSHAVTDLEPLASRVAVLRDGALVALDTPAALCRQSGTDRLEAAVVALLGEERAA